MRLLLAFAALMVFAAPLHADETKRDTISVGHGIICNTSEQALRFVALRNEGSETVQAIKVINQEADNPTACGAAIIAFRIDEETDQQRMNGQRVRVVKVVVSAINNGAQWAPVPDVVQYALLALEGIEV